MCGFIAQLVEQRTGNAEVTGSNPVEALIFFFRLLLSNCLNWKIYCDDHSSLSRVQIMENCGRIVFYNNFIFTSARFLRKSLREATFFLLRDMLRHFHGLYSHRPQLSTNQRERIRSVIVKNVFDEHFISIADTIINNTINTVNSAYLKFQNAMFQKSSNHSHQMLQSDLIESAPLCKINRCSCSESSKSNKLHLVSPQS